MGPNVNDSAVYVLKFALWVLNGDIGTNADIGEVVGMSVVELFRFLLTICCLLLSLLSSVLPFVGKGPTMSRDHVLYGVAIQFLCRRETILAGGCVAVLQEGMA